MSSINEIIEDLNVIENNIEETEELELCVDIYNKMNQFKSEHGISIPFEVSKKIDKIIESAHKKYDNLSYNKDDIVRSLHSLTDNVQHIVKYHKRRSRQMLII